MWHSGVQGFLVGMSLIFAIGAQNAFVLKQGLKQEHVFWLCLVCACSDALLIFAGVFGFGYLIQMYPHFIVLAQYLGAIFLCVYGAQHFYQAWTQQQGLVASQQESTSLTKVLGICLALTWLNPHVYLDTVVLIGAVSTQFEQFKYTFAFGASLASFMFFFSLGYAARYLQPVFKYPQSWKIFDILIGILMWAIAYSLLQ